MTIYTVRDASAAPGRPAVPDGPRRASPARVAPARRRR